MLKIINAATPPMNKYLGKPLNATSVSTESEESIVQKTHNNMAKYS